MPEEILIRDMPETVFEEAKELLVPYIIGFLELRDTPSGQDVRLLGSGTLVSIGATKAILTAHHVVKILPSTGRLGLILSSTLQYHTVDTQGLTFLQIARGSIDAEGPDLGAVILSPAIASTIGSSKSFYNLDSRRERILYSPPNINEGFWFVNGFVDEYTWEEPGSGKYEKIKGFYNFSGAGGPEKPIVVGDHDYFAFPVSSEGRSAAPERFGGMSGGGLWQIKLTRDTYGCLRPTQPLLSGVVFYQEETTETQCGVKCHGRQSVYHVAYDAISACRVK